MEKFEFFEDKIVGRFEKIYEYVDYTVLELIQKKFQFGKKDISRNELKFQIDSISSFVTNQFIISKFSPPTLYRIVSISFDKNPKNTEFKKEGKTVSINDFFLKFHEIEIKDKDQPLLLCEEISINNLGKIKLKNKGTKINYLPCELCYFVNINDLSLINLKSSEKLNNNNEISVENFEENISAGSSDDCIGTSNIFNIFDYLGQILEIEQDENNNFLINPIEGNSFFNKNKKGFFQSKLLYKKWCYCFPKSLASRSKKILNGIFSSAKYFYVALEEPEELTYSENTESLINSLQDFFKTNISIQYSLITIVTEAKDKEFYQIIKKFCTEEIGIISQILKCDKVKILSKSYFNSLMIQMISKSGNELFRINFSRFIKTPKSLMTVGVFFTKDKNDSLIITFISSYNEYFNNYRLKYYKTANDFVGIKVAVQNGLLDAIQNSEITFELNPKQFIIYLDTDLFLKDISITFSLFIRSMKGFFTSNLSKKENLTYAVISPKILTNTGTSIFSFNIIKRRKQKLFFVYENTTGFSIDIIKNFTFKLTFYCWNCYHSVNFPICMKYSEIATKLIKKLNLGDVKQRLLNEPFYL